jgi:hypothetical protein
MLVAIISFLLDNVMFHKRVVLTVQNRTVAKKYNTNF